MQTFPGESGQEKYSKEAPQSINRRPERPLWAAAQAEHRGLYNKKNVVPVLEVARCGARWITFFPSRFAPFLLYPRAPSEEKVAGGKLLFSPSSSSKARPAPSNPLLQTSRTHRTHAARSPTEINTYTRAHSRSLEIIYTVALLVFVLQVVFVIVVCTVCVCVFRLCCVYVYLCV